jgi:hypothetical protein
VGAVEHKVYLERSRIKASVESNSFSNFSDQSLLIFDGQIISDLTSLVRKIDSLPRIGAKQTKAIWLHLLLRSIISDWLEKIIDIGIVHTISNCFIQIRIAISILQS